MASLYELTQEQLHLYNMLISGDAIDIETGEIDPVVAELLEFNSKDLDKKIVSTGLIYKQLMADVEVMKKEEENLEIRRKRRERNAELVKLRLQNAMIMLGRDKFYDPKLEISFRGSAKVEIDNESIIPREFFAEKTTYTPIKSSICAAIRDGVDVPGARLVEVKNIQIK